MKKTVAIALANMIAGLTLFSLHSLHAQDACNVPSATPTLDQCKDANGNVLIGAGAPGQCTGAVVLGNQTTVGNITIASDGALLLGPKDAKGVNVTLLTSGIDIKSGGSLIIGGASCPIGSRNSSSNVTFVFTGPKPASCGTPNNSPSSQCPGYVKGIQVEAGGTLRMYGQKGVPPQGVNWTYLSQPAGPPQYNRLSANYIGNVLAPVSASATELHLAADVGTGPASWKSGDWIAVATTSFSPWETEFVQLAADPQAEGSGSKLKLSQPLQHYHFGGANPGDPSGDSNLDAGPDLNYGVDERAEVGLVSRNIILTSDADSAGALHWGGEIRVLPGFSAVALQGVELQKFGKEQLGSYPFHLHMAGDLAAYSPANKLFDSNSIDHSYNKCVTVHMTDNATVSNNVCARITGHIFYEEMGTETNISFNGDLGMGAMSNSFDVNATADQSRAELIANYYWTGDNMFPAAAGTFNQFGIYDTDDQSNPSHGQCGYINSQGQLTLTGPPFSACPTPQPNQVSAYFEPPSGFWITNPSTKLVGNSIAGCQDDGKAYWYVPSPESSNTAAKFIPIGPTYPEPHGLFTNNRGHACYHGLYDDQDVAVADSLFGYQGGIHDAAHQQVVDEFDQVTMTRMRDRAIWLRPTFFYVKDARVASSRDGVTLLTSGGVDGNYPGAWGLLQHSSIVGVSTNNVDRWGPCGSVVRSSDGEQIRGAQMGCIDQTVPNNGTALGGEYLERGYPTPDWPMFGFLVYDGPPLIVNDRFVNYRVAPGSVGVDEFPAANLLSGQDDKILQDWNFYAIAGQSPYSAYEGDAAIGWFNANQSSYPTASTTKELSFTNVDLRHQVYTEEVNRGQFTDGDKNTTVLDLDGTLSGFEALDVNGDTLPTISLNNLEFNASSNSVDECLATGSQDSLLEARPTAGMVPSPIGQLEFEMLYPNPPSGEEYLGFTQNLTFSKNTVDFGEHAAMTLKSRNGLGDWEPKVTSGYGYTVTASPYTALDGTKTEAGIAANVDVSITDIANVEIRPGHPFYVQVGICYKPQNGRPPVDKFTITKGYRSYGSGNVVTSSSINDQTVINTALRQYYNPLLGLYPTPSQVCNNLDSQMPPGSPPPALPSGCPAPGIALRHDAGCPVGTKADTDLQGQAVCVYPTTRLTEVSSINQMTTDGTLNGPPSLNNFFYDAQRGLLFFWVAQNDPNAAGQSPLGNCTGSPSDPSFCPDHSTGDTYYVCPPEGCSTYRISLNDPTYKPGPSDCANNVVYGPYVWPGPPPNQNQLILAGTNTVVTRMSEGGVGNNFPHYISNSPPACPFDATATPTLGGTERKHRHHHPGDER